jgi:hypothetical protein
VTPGETIVALRVDEARMLVEWADRAVSERQYHGEDVPDVLVDLLKRLQRDLPGEPS